MTAEEITQYLTELSKTPDTTQDSIFYRRPTESMIATLETKRRMVDEPRWWKIALMDFVDDFHYHRDVAAIAEPFEIGDETKDAVFASTIETLCDEMKLPIPAWLDDVPACKQPCFLSRVEALKAFSLAESPVHFRLRRVFVGENFLFRV